MFSIFALAVGALLLTVGPTRVGCFYSGGANMNQRQPGNNDDGINVGFGEIAVEPNGEYFVTNRESQLIYVDMISREMKMLPGIHYPDRIALGHGARKLYYTNYDRFELCMYSPEEEQVGWCSSIDNEENYYSPYLTLTKDDRFVLLTFMEHIKLFDAQTGQLIRTHSFNRYIIDVDLLPDLGHVLVTTTHRWSNDLPTTIMSLISLDEGTRENIEVPNCSSEAVITPDGKYAFLAPTICTQDPVSVIDLEARKFVKNLPGFGPVAMSSDGITAVAFMDTHNLDESLFADGQEIPSAADGRYHMMLINTVSLDFDSVPLGEDLPRYALTPDGNVLLIDFAFFGTEMIRILDIPSRSIQVVEGPAIRLDEFVITSDSSLVYLLDAGLYRISIAQAKLTTVPLDFIPSSINITPNDTYLILKDYDDAIYLFDILENNVVDSYFND
jgi:WD40 repeat protein